MPCNDGSQNGIPRLRVTTGCRTCRTRHVKCDEHKPICGNCTKKNRPCVYEARSPGRSRLSSDKPAHQSRGDVRGSSTDASTVFGSKATAPFCESPIRDEIQPVTTPASFGPVLAQYLSDRSSSGEPFRILRNNIYKDPNRNEHVLQQNSTHSASPTYSNQGNNQNLLFSQEHSSKGSIRSSPKASRNSSLETGSPLRAHSPSISCSPSESRSRRDGLDHFECSTISNSHSHPGAIKPSSPLVASGSNSPLYLTELELFIFRNFVERVARWIEAFSSENPCSTVVPVLALECPAVLFSCLAISAKQLALTRTGDEPQIREDVAVQYYQKALKAFSALLMKPDSAHSDEILASSIMLSSYEMLDVVGENFGSHLRGIASLLQLWQVNGDSPGIKGVVYWTWYRSDTWAALHAGRRMFLDEHYWEPHAVESFDDLSHEEIANRAMFLLGQCISFCNDDLGPENAETAETLDSRQITRTKIRNALEQWKRMLPPSMTRFVASQVLRESQQEEATTQQYSRDISSMWFVFPHCAVGIQMYHAGQILLALSGPPLPSRRQGRKTSTSTVESLAARRLINQSREQILLIASSGMTDAFNFISTQCLYIAGLVTEGVQERRRTLELIEECQRQSGRRTVCIADELRASWAEEW